MELILFDQMVVLVSDSEVFFFGLASVQSSYPPVGFSKEEIDRFLLSVSENNFRVFSLADSGIFEVNSSWAGLSQQMVDGVSSSLVEGVLVGHVLVSLNPSPGVWGEVALSVLVSFASLLISGYEVFIFTLKFVVLSTSAGVVNDLDPLGAVVLELSFVQTLNNFSSPVSANMTRFQTSSENNLGFSSVQTSTEVFSNIVWGGNSADNLELWLEGSLTGSDTGSKSRLNLSPSQLALRGMELTSENVVIESRSGSLLAFLNIESSWEAWDSPLNLSSANRSGLVL
jgi:hypothetical protein